MMIEADASLVLARAKLNFARKGHAERCWDAEGTDAAMISDCARLPLSDNEREEFLEQARHELRQEIRAP